MTDEQINAAIHDALNNPVGCPRCSDPECSYNQGLNYCADLNAMHEAEKVLVGHEGNRYGGFCIYLTNYNLTLVGLEAAIHATARQRAEAFLRTLGKWQEATDKDSLTVGGATTEESSVDQKEVQK